ncbi:MAG: hypothetical protein C4554_01830 [Dethiobacter sp.]|jgi:multicomponent Na+:H+ antiporter subunit B|nr:MAG: hypothetical protein C4554_01830 [Dethiobacter sp.]
MTVNWREIIYMGLIILLVAMVALVLLMTVMEMPIYGEVTNPSNNYVMRRYIDMGIKESGGYNYVTNIVLDYRGYDTLLETTVIFTGVMAIMVLWGVQK